MQAHSMIEYIPFSSVEVPPRYLVRTMQLAEFYIAPKFEQPIGPDTIVIDLVTSGAFGSGAHPTTQLCLEALATFVTPDSTVLDIGCGSGVLAIAAAKLGARKTIAVDIEQAAVIRTRDNAGMNRVVDAIDVRLGTTEAALPDAPFSVITGNLLTPIIIKLAPLLSPLLTPSGMMILSGILDVQADRVRSALTDHGFQIHESRSKSGWCGLIVGAG
jgi:ribosomal protein L11 methyltransferase